MSELYPNKIIYGGNVILDLTEDTIMEECLLDGYTAHDKSGRRIEGKLKLNNDISFVTRSLTQYKSDSISEVGAYAFSGSSYLTMVDFANLKHISKNAFCDCTVLSSIILRSKEMCVLENINAFRNTPIERRTGYIYVSPELIAEYKNNEVWNVFSSCLRSVAELPGNGDYYTIEEMKCMSEDEIRRNMDKIFRSLEHNKNN